VGKLPAQLVGMDEHSLHWTYNVVAINVTWHAPVQEQQLAKTYQLATTEYTTRATIVKLRVS
jgi:hypothetical protein